MFHFPPKDESLRSHLTSLVARGLIDNVEAYRDPRDHILVSIENHYQFCDHCALVTMADRVVPAISLKGKDDE
jgi:hypothetical protein